MNKEKIIITGCSGFIGKHLCEFLLSKNYFVIGIDKNDCDIINSNFYFIKQDLLIFSDLPNADYIIHLAALVGVSDSLRNPTDYYNNNIQSFDNIINISSKIGVKKILFASSSSIYGDNFNQCENENKFNPMSPYAISKCINEHQAEVARNLLKIPIVSLRFFNVYGPNLRKDLAGYIFMNNIYLEKPIFIFGKDIKRDFTYIDDVLYAIYLVLTKGKNKCYNIGKSNPDNIIDFVRLIENKFSKKAIINYCEKNNYEPTITQANCNLLNFELSYKANTKLYEGVEKMCDWFLSII